MRLNRAQNAHASKVRMIQIKWDPNLRKPNSKATINAQMTTKKSKKTKAKKIYKASVRKKKKEINTKLKGFQAVRKLPFNMQNIIMKQVIPLRPKPKTQKRKRN